MKDATLEKAVVAKTSMEDSFDKGDYMRFACSLSGKDRSDKATLQIHSKADDLEYSKWLDTADISSSRVGALQLFHRKEKFLF